MKSISVILLTVGLATALTTQPGQHKPSTSFRVRMRQANESAAAVEAAAAAAAANPAALTPEEEAAQEGVVQVDGNDAAAAAAAQAAAEAAAGVNVDNLNLDNLNLDGVNLDGLNLDSLNLGGGGGNDAIAQLLSGLALDQGAGFAGLQGLDFLSGIESLLFNMGLGSFVDVNALGGFGFDQQLEIFLLLNQLNQLMGFGFINQLDVLGLIQQGLLLNQFNFQFFKRTVGEWTENHARKVRRETREERMKLRRRQVACIPAGFASAVPAAAAPVAAIPAAAPVAAVPAAAPQVESTVQDGVQTTDLSDFTK
jgi:hypothetical protein